MGMPRTPIADLRLRNDKNIKRSLSYSASKKLVLAHRAELEELWKDVTARRAEAIAEIKRDGLTIIKERMSNGQLFTERVTHPALKIAQACERQLASLARLLSTPESDSSAPSRSGLDAELDAAFAEFEEKKTDA